MQRTVVGVLLGAAFVAALVWATLRETSASCEVCVEFEGRRACNRSSAATREAALQQAQSSACSRVSGGVTEIMACTAMRATESRCDP